MRIRTIERHLLEVNQDELEALRQMLQLFISSPLPKTIGMTSSHLGIIKALQVEPLIDVSIGNEENGTVEDEYTALSLAERVLNQRGSSGRRRPKASKFREDVIEQE